MGAGNPMPSYLMETGNISPAESIAQGRYKVADQPLRFLGFKFIQFMNTIFKT